jgi:hypothetical protein
MSGTAMMSLLFATWASQQRLTSPVGINLFTYSN